MRYFHTAVFLVCVGGAALVSAVPITGTEITGVTGGDHVKIPSNLARALDDELAVRDVQYADVHLPREAAERGLAQRDLEVLDRRLFGWYHNWRAKSNEKKALEAEKQAAILRTKAQEHRQKAGSASAPASAPANHGGSSYGGPSGGGNTGNEGY